ncbi:M24 family metallopeptidase [Mangrovihabitans endophyticus]|uniref:Dipeptidase n=1 Tax=Mangrovihabitans endophyticus TaxID=1751298 RepID=A0A8J3C4R6_9ACTN|nr:Xaa-Pro peptidase family protein [Mangrovihabitans endophyticus]GGL08251.1 dipeptidase [Mangrovihabitans endophyticus]
MLWSAEEFRQRLTRAGRAVAEQGWAALLVTPGSDLRYLTGYRATPSERLTCLVVPAAGEVTLVVPRLERPAAEASPAGDLGLRLVDHPDGDDAVRLVADALPATVGVFGVADTMPAAHLLPLQGLLLGSQWQPAGQALGALRAVKSADEVAALAAAGAAIDEVHRRMPRWLRAGRTELEVAADIATAIRDVGHASADFVIVASGPGAASPHHDSGDRTIQRGDPVVVDIGGTMPDGYCSDCTRTYVVGPTAPDGFRDYYAVLHAAQRAAVAAAAPGVPAEAVDAAAREPIAAAGFAAEFLHRTGHGIGLDTHEEPYIVAGNAEPLRAGMAFSVEPGIYLSGRHGARIEDIVVCTTDGPRRLNTTGTALVHV